MAEKLKTRSGLEWDSTLYRRFINILLQVNGGLPCTLEISDCDIDAVVENVYPEWGLGRLKYYNSLRKFMKKYENIIRFDSESERLISQ